VKLRDFVAHLERNGCVFAREGARHTVYVNPINRRSAAVPRHPEVKKGVVKRVCKDLEIQAPS
jgi:predicted RNA binding protein YcfA (HicA-like mRNA interferase family)